MVFYEIPGEPARQCVQDMIFYSWNKCAEQLNQYIQENRFLSENKMSVSVLTRYRHFVHGKPEANVLENVLRFEIGWKSEKGA